MNIHSLLDRAREKSGAKSERSLARAVGLTHTALRRISRGESLPSDNTMIGIAGVAQLSEEEALLLLNIWRSTGRATAIYGRLHKSLMEAQPQSKSKKRQLATLGEQIAK